MHLHLDAGGLTPTVELRDPDDFGSFKAVVAVPSHMWLDPADLARLAGRAGDQEWLGRLEEMVAYARSKGWVDEHGRVRTHVEVSTDH